MFRVASFDVFDTCLTRDVAFPTDLFYELAKEMLPQFGVDITEEAIKHFVAARCQAFEAAKSAKQVEDVVLPEIWLELCKQMGWPYSDKHWERELAVEERHLFPVHAVRKVIQDFREEGKRILFTSDTYFPRTFIEQLLLRNHFMQPGDGLYVSGEIRKTKRSGSLFQHILAVEKINTSQIMHFGDDVHTDIKMPRKLGIKATLLQQGGLGRTEQLLLRQRGINHLTVSRVAGAIRAFRATEARTVDNNECKELVASFLGPVVLGFASWVLAQAQRDGVERLYFVSRDCQLTFKAAQILAPKFGGIDCRYLYHSRQSLHLALAEGIDEHQMWWMRLDFEVPILERLLAKLELKFDDVSSDFGDFAGSQRGKYLLQSDDDWRQFWKILNQPVLRARIMKLIEQRRAAAEKYFRDSGLFDASRWALADLGWALGCQKVLRLFLKFRGRDGELAGYYLGLKAARAPATQAGMAKGLFYQEPYDRPAGFRQSSLFSYIVPLEFVLGCADHPTVHHYELRGGSAEPAFAGRKLDETEKRFVSQLHETTLRFVQANKDLSSEFRDEDSTRSVLGTIIDRFTLQPDAQLVAPLQQVEAAKDQNLLDAEPLVAPLCHAEVLRLIIPDPVRRFFRISRPSRIWMEGSLAASNPAVKKLVAVRRLAQSLRKNLDLSITD